MKKILIGVIAIVVIAGVGAPYINGWIMEHVVKRSCQDINEMYAETGTGISLELVRYDRGYLTSAVRWKIHLGNLRNLYDVKEIAVLNTAKHGLTGVVSQASLEPNEWYADFIKEKLAGKDPVHISSRFGLTGNFETIVTLDAFAFLLNKEMANVRAGEMKITCSRNLQTVATEGVWQGLTIPGKAFLDGFSMQGDFTKVTTCIWDGDFSLGFNRLELEQGARAVEMSDLTVGYGVDFNNDTHTLDMNIAYGIGSVTDRRGRIVDDAAIRCSVNKMDGQGYEEFVRTYMRTVNTVINNVAVTSQDSDQEGKHIQNKMEMLGPQMIAIYEKILKKGLEFRIKELRMKLPQGDVSGTLALGLKQDIVFAQVIQVMQNPSFLLELFSLQSDVNLPAELIGNATTLTTPLFGGMQTGLFIKKENRLIHKAETRDGRLILNGQPVVL